MTSADDRVQPFVGIEGVEEQAIVLLRAGDIAGTLTGLRATAHRLRNDEAFRGRALYCAQLDNLVQTVGQLVTESEALSFAPGTRPLIVATEIHVIGGHTRLIADLCAMSHPAPMLILTDALENYARANLSIDDVHAQFPGTSVLMLPPGNLETKLRNLLRTIAALAPSRLVLFAHHEDAVAYAAANEKLPIPQWLVHHCDFNPALGSTVAHYRHIDITRQSQGLCRQFLGRDTFYLPVCAPDRGIKAFDAPPGAPHTLTCASFNKLDICGPLAYHALVAALLKSGTARHTHVGELPPAYLELIAQTLDAAGVDPQRFEYVAQVASLWPFLLGCGANVYVPSAPVGGLRATVEAMGAGYPIAYYPARELPFVAAISSLPPGAPQWTNAEELVAAVSACMRQHAALSAASRAHYDAHFSDALFRAAAETGGVG